MKAVAVFPGKPNSIHLADLPEPKVDEILGGRGVLVEVLRVGVDGTDKEINDAEYGEAPVGYEFLVIGHESFGRVLEVGPNVRGLEPGHYHGGSDRGLSKTVLTMPPVTNQDQPDMDLSCGVDFTTGDVAEVVE